jgi:hypothetical protein
MRVLEEEAGMIMILIALQGDQGVRMIIPCPAAHPVVHHLASSMLPGPTLSRVV